MDLRLRRFVLRKKRSVAGVQIVGAGSGGRGKRRLNFAERHLDVVSVRDPLRALDQLNDGDGGGSAANQEKSEGGSESQPGLFSRRHGRQATKHSRSPGLRFHCETYDTA